MVLRQAVAIAVILGLVSCASAAEAEINKCQAAKKKCVGKHVACVLGCTTNCGKCDEKFDGRLLWTPDAGRGCLQRVQAKGDCLTADETGYMLANDEGFWADVTTRLDHDHSRPSKCRLAKQKCIGKAARCRLACHAKFGADAALTTPCLLKCNQKLDGNLQTPPDPDAGCIRKVEHKSACAGPDETAQATAMLDAFTEAVLCALEPNAAALGIQCDRRLVFSTSAIYDGNLGGLAGADAKCQAAADAAELPGAFKAWLSASTASAAARLEHSPVPYRLLGGAQVADDWTDLTDGSIDHLIDIEEHGQPIIYVFPQSNFVWTGTLADGSAALATATDVCDDWTSASHSLGAIFGARNEEFSFYPYDWTELFGAECDYFPGMALYCFEQAP